ncbi:MAG: DsbE family thiol:disulfide interchange protein [Pseudomonadota bacterium]|nr:DsbE family thiol:disulfide interchange protein [Pseudomonadota bacterium]
MKNIFVIAPLVVFAAIAGAFAVGLTRDPSAIPSTLIDRPLPEFDLPPIEGYDKRLAAADLKGEVSLLNVFGSWCVSCHVEHPFLMQIAAAGEVPIHGLNWKDKPGDGAAWLARLGNPYDRIGDDPEGRVIFDLGVTGAPETFVIDKEGRVRYKHVGPVTPEVWEKTLRPLIEKLKRA